MLGPTAAEGLVSALARRGGSVARPLVTAVRTAAAAGEIVRDVAGDVVTWRTRRRRLLRKPARAGSSAHPPHVAALDAHTRRAWDVCVAAGDGIDRYALRGLLRVVLGAPDVTPLEAHGLLDALGTTVDLGRTAGSYEGDASLQGRASALQTSGSLNVLAEAERSLEGRAPDAASRFARAARASLAVGDLAAAVRLAGVARTLPRPAGDRAVEEALRAIAAQLGRLQVMTPRDARPILTPEALEAAAASRASNGNVAGAARLRALASLLQGDLRPAMQVGREASSVRDLVVASLAHARSGQLPEAARAAVAGLARARREGDGHGEQATLALLASVFGAAGRADDVGRFTAAMRG